MTKDITREYPHFKKRYKNIINESMTETTAPFVHSVGKSLQIEKPQQSARTLLVDPINQSDAV